MFNSVIDLENETAEERRQAKAQSVFVGLEQVQAAYATGTTDDARQSALEGLLGSVAREQGIDFHPRMPLTYGYLTGKRGFWFHNRLGGVGLADAMEPMGYLLKAAAIV
jgi:hypothetical protein